MRIIGRIRAAMAAARGMTRSHRANFRDQSEQDPKATAPRQGEDWKECHGLIVEDRDVLSVLKKQRRDDESENCDWIEPSPNAEDPSNRGSNVKEVMEIKDSNVLNRLHPGAALATRGEIEVEQVPRDPEKANVLANIGMPHNPDLRK